MNESRWWDRLFVPPRFILYQGYRLGFAKCGIRLHDDGRVEWFIDVKWRDESTMNHSEREYARGCQWEPQLPVEIRKIIWGNVNQ